MGDGKVNLLLGYQRNSRQEYEEEENPKECGLDFLLHTITDEREIKILFELLEKRNEQRKSTIVCSQRDPDNWKAMILNDEVSANSIMKRATKHYTVKINTR